MNRLNHHLSASGGVDLSRLDNVRERGAKVEAACPACRELGRDSAGDHFFLNLHTGQWGCARNAGDKAHRRRIWELVGQKVERDWPLTHSGVRGRVRTKGEFAPLTEPNPERLESGFPFAPAVDVRERLRRDCVKFRAASPDDFACLSALRCVNVEAVKLAVSRGLVSFGSCFGHASWIITDSRGDFFQARRMDGRKWSASTVHGKDYKAHTIGHHRAVGVAEAAAFDRVAIVEGGPDILAALSFAWAEEIADEVGIICMPGTGAGLSPDDVAALAGKRIRIFPHNDASGAGRKSARRWGQSLVTSCPRVELIDLAKIQTCSGSPAGDLNDLAGYGDSGGMCPDYWEHSTLARNLMSF